MLRDNEVKALVATSALGMGFDKPDLGFVLHLGAPSSPVAYYQQVGRAGRATERADVLLLPGPEDRDIWAYFASSSMPRQEQADAVLQALGESGRPLSTVALESIVDIRRTRLELLLKVLDVDGAVQRVPGGWASTGNPWTYDAERYARVSQARDREQDLMVGYEETDGCRMEFLQKALDDATAAPCGRCDRCAGAWFPDSVPDTALTTARGRLERAGVELEPRAQWPSGMDRLGVPLKGRISPDETLEVCGRCCGSPTLLRPKSSCGRASRSCATGTGDNGPRPSWPSPRAPGPSSSSRSLGASPRWAALTGSASSTWSTAARSATQGATAPSGWPGCGAGWPSAPPSAQPWAA
jgi:ATP-dependent DNA helicase RecQ